MPQAKFPVATLGGSPADIEAAFYDALQRGDVDQVMACWADEDEIVCVHPGGARLIGAGSIRAAFEALLGAQGLPVRPEQVHRIDALACAVHHVLERLEVATEQGPQTGWVVATNVYHKTAQGWRMVAHHASPATAQDLQGPASPPVLH